MSARKMYISPDAISAGEQAFGRPADLNLRAMPCGGYPHLFEHKSNKRSSAPTIICVFCGQHAVPWTPEQLAKAATAYREGQ